jgi:hypothetical protein
MSGLPFAIPNLQTEDIGKITTIFNYLKSNFQIDYDNEDSNNFRKFEIFSNRKINPGISIRITNDFRTFYLAFIEVGYSYGYASKYIHPPAYEYQTWGITTLKNDFGHILIKSESLLDKIQALINPIEIDFKDDKEFSKKFYVVTDNGLKARSFFVQGAKTSIENILAKDFIIEIIGNQLIIGDRKIIETDSALEFVKFMDKISKTS